MGNQPPEREPTYLVLRNQVLSLTSEDLGIPDPTQVLAVLMETAYPEAVATLVVIADGSTSLYFSSGGGVLGAGDHSKVAAISKQLVKDADACDFGFDTATSHPQPALGNVRFYLVRSDKILTAEVLADDLGNDRHPLSPLFHRGHEVISAVLELGG